jgi:CheY-like chemotaxis protein
MGNGWSQHFDKAAVMRLEFRLLVIDDNPPVDAIELLSDHLVSQGFTLKHELAQDLSDAGLKNLARQAGKNYDLVAVDYNLGRDDTNGAIAASRMRHELQFTDIVFYSSDLNIDLFDELSKQHVPGVFVSGRLELDGALKGLADTVIGKAVDLSHMRGIAMAEVADMDVLMDEVLEIVFSSQKPELVAKGAETLAKLLEGAEKSVEGLRELVNRGAILDVVTDSRLFSSMQKYKAINRVVRCLADRPHDAIEVLKAYDPEILQHRNTLAHAKEDVGEDGSVSLRAIKRGKPSVVIDDAWMVSFRERLHAHRAALAIVCEALSAYVETPDEGSET